MSRYRLRTLGRLSLHDEGDGGRVVLSDAKALAVLAYLSDTPGAAGDREHLARMLWPGKDASRARAGLRQALYYLRRKTADGESLLRSDEGRVALDRRHLETDLWDFGEALSRGDWEAALDLYRGTFLGGYGVEGAEEFRHWREGRDDGVRAGVREGCRALVSEGLEADDPARALRGARRWVELNPLDEEAQSALVRSLAADGDRLAAFRAYESYRTLLREELGESPGSALVGVLEELRSAHGEQPREEASGSWHPEAVRAAGAAAGRTSPAAATPASGLGRGAAVAVLLLTVLLLVAAGWRLLAGAGDGAEEASADAALVALVRSDGGGARPVFHAIRWSGDTARVEEASSPGGIPSPDGTLVAASASTPGGPDVEVRRAGEREGRRLVATDADEIPVAWSPDGEWLLYLSGRVESDGDYVRRYRIRRLDGSRDLLLGPPVADLPGRRWADWSPLGTAVALVSDSAGDMDVWSVDPDGTDPRNLTAGHGGRDAEPAYSPDGTRIAFVSDRSGNRDVWLMGAGGEDPRRLTWTRRAETGPIWLAAHTVGYVRIREGGAEVRSIDLATGDDRILAELPGFESWVSLRGPGVPAPWITSVELPGHLDRVAPGQWIRRSAVIRDSRGEELPAVGVSLDWSVSDTAVVDPGRPGGWLRVRGTGEAMLRVSAGGWRGDSLRLRSRAPEPRELPPVMSEDWSGGVDKTRWVPVGEPAPAVVGPAGRFPRAFLNRGDENHHSGAVFRRPVRAGRGLTLEFWGRAPFTAPHHQGLIAGLVRDLPPPGAPVWGPRRAPVELTLGAEVPDSLGVRLAGRDRHVPAPDSADAWHRYALQVDSAGRWSLLVDGRVHWRSPETTEPGLVDGTHVAVYGRSKGAGVLHGPVRAWEGARYRFP